MIECTDKNVYYKKRRKKKSKRFLSVFLVLAVVVGAFFYYRNVIEVNIINICTDYLKAYSTQSVNEAVLECINDNPYSQFVTIEKNSQGDVVLISTDSIKVNELNKKISIKTQSILEEKLKSGVKIPFLAFSGIKFLSGYGSTVDFKTVSISNVSCDFADKLVSAGINQTLHSLYLTVKTEATLNMPTVKKSEKCETSVLLGEAVIVGKIPEIYVKT
ncbi:MAG: sporulation protein YunB [Clostridia bacterium]|nr:sporulation protein YunB [Clostridia bacterium]